jgi:FkbM family methyltransferase
MKIFDRIKYWGGSVVEKQPHTQFLVKKLLLRTPWLLPHDKSYLGFQHCLDHPCRLFLDVGANDGVSAASFRRIDSTFKILSIEPNAYHEPSLKRLAGRLGGMEYRLIGGGDEEATLTLHVPFYGSLPLHQSASLVRQQAEINIHRWMPPRVARKVRYESCTVQVVPLDSLGIEPGIIKVDAEGFDHKVLAGLTQTISNCRPYILAEIHPETEDHITGFCGRHDYSILDYDAAANGFAPYDGARTRNIFCVPREREQRLLNVASKRTWRKAA